MTLSSRHRIRNSSHGGLRPSTLPLGHRGSPQYWLSHVDGESTFKSYYVIFIQNSVMGKSTSRTYWLSSIGFPGSLYPPPLHQRYPHPERYGAARWSWRWECKLCLINNPFSTAGYTRHTSLTLIMLITTIVVLFCFISRPNHEDLQIFVLKLDKYE